MPRRQRSRGMRVQSVACVRRVKREDARELERHSSNGGREVAAGGRRRSVREKDPRPPLWLI